MAGKPMSIDNYKSCVYSLQMNESRTILLPTGSKVHS